MWSTGPAWLSGLPESYRSVRPGFCGRANQVDELRRFGVLRGRGRPVSRDYDPTHGALRAGASTIIRAKARSVVAHFMGLILPPDVGRCCALFPLRV